MTTSAHAPRGTASDSLLVKVNPDNILQFRNAYLTQQNALFAAVREARLNLSRTLPADDPISHYYAPIFDRKINTVVDRVDAHAYELREATDRLAEAAREYGFTDDAISQSFQSFTDREAAVARTPGPPMIADR